MQDRSEPVLSVIAYASLAIPNVDPKTDVEFLKQWCARIPLPIKIVVEDLPPNEPVRPLWIDLLAQIERGTISVLVVPSLRHLVGEDLIALSKFVTFLKAHQVTLKSLAELVDSKRDSKTEIVLRLMRSTQKNPEI